MKTLYLLTLLHFWSIVAFAQIPTIAGGAGNNCSSTFANQVNGGDATGVGCGGGGAGYFGGHGGKGYLGGGGGGAAGYSAIDRKGGDGGNGAVVVSFYNASNIIIYTYLYTSSNIITIPSGITSVKVWAIGAGGGGAGSINNDGTSGGGGGAGGISYITKLVNTGNTISFTIGTGGIGGTHNVNGNAGTATQANVVGAAIIGNGGAGGQYNNSTDAIGGTFAGGDGGANGGNGKGVAGDAGGGGGGGTGGGYTNTISCAGGNGANSIDVSGLYAALATNSFIFDLTPSVYYPFNGNANDAIGSLDGTVNGATLTTDRFGNANSAYNFNGISNYIEVSDGAAVRPNLLTVCAWVLPLSPTVSGGWQNVLSKRNSSTVYSYNLAASNNTPNQWNAQLPFGSAISTNNITPNQWIFIAYTFDGNTIRLYENGNLISSTTVSNTLTYDNSPLRIGTGSLTSNDWFSGSIDEVKIFNGVLNQQQILTQMGFPPLVAHYPLNGNADDSSSNQLHGTIQGSLTSVSDRFGNSNGALAFQGNINNYIQVPDNNLLHLPNFTLSAWAKFSNTTGLQTLIDKPLNCNNDSWHLGSSGSSFSAWVTNSPTCGDFAQSTYPLTTNVWKHLTFTLDAVNNTRRLYVDGVQVSDASYSGTIPYDNQPMYFGAAIENGALNFPFSGHLDDIKIFGYALTASQVVSLYIQSNQLIAGSIGYDETVCNPGISSAITNLALAVSGNGLTVAYQWQDSTASGSWQNISGATNNSYTPTGLTTTTYYRRKATSGTLVSYSNTVQKTVVNSSGHPSIIPNNQWHFYNYNGTNVDSTNVHYLGYYVVNSLNFNTQNEFNNNVSPSNASGYAGCPNASDNAWSLYAKRKGFPANPYVLNINSNDDAIKIFKDGVLLASAGCCNSLNGTFYTLGTLNANTIIECRVTNYGGPGFLSITLQEQNLVGGAIGSNQVVCNTGIPATFTNTGSAYGGATANITYQWQDSVANGTWQNITGATNATYLPITPLIQTWYRRKASNASETAFSNIVNIQIVQVVGDTSIYGNNEWRIYGYDGQDIELNTTTYSGYYTSPNLDINTSNDWNIGASPSAAINYQGCPINNEYFTWVLKRKGFAYGPYAINMSGHDDGVRIYVNGVNVFEHIDCCDAHNGITLGILDSNSTIEIRMYDLYSAAYLNASFIVTALQGGSISGSQTNCGSFIPTLFTNNLNAYGGNTTSIQYQWQSSNDNITFTNITGATNATYQSATISNDTYFRRQAYNGTQTVYSNSIFIDIIINTWHQDADGDGFGNATIVQNICSQPIGYVANNLDCNDTDSLQRPGRVWFVDADNDGYGTGLNIVQCIRPSDAFVAAELVATTGDCNDNDPLINPSSQYFTYTSSPNFTGSYCSPLNGSPSTLFQFEVNYFSDNGALPPVTYPRILLDYEGNGIYTGVNDRSIIMTPFDLNDNNAADGKKYIASISSLPTGTAWKTLIESSEGICQTFAGPYNYPDVQLQPDIEIFANDISFSATNPALSSQLTINATIHNESDFAAQNFIVHLRNQFDTSIVYQNILVPFLAAQSSTTVNWVITTPNVPAWCPMKVSIDYTNVIAESNELDNEAIRPYINGNYALPASINVSSTVSPNVSYIGSGGILLSGTANYVGSPLPLVNTGVAGATVTFSIQETGASYAGYTDVNGNFSIPILAPNTPGVFHIQGSVTDFNLTQTFSNTFERIFQNCVLADLSATINLNGTSTLVTGTNLLGSFIITNHGSSTSAPTILNLSNSGGTPSLSPINIPAIAPNASFSSNFNLLFANVGTYNICATIDPNNLISECNEANNTTCQTISVLAALPDIIPANFSTSTYVYNCEMNSIDFTVLNHGAGNAATFNCQLAISRNGVLINTIQQQVPNLGSIFSPSGNQFTFTIPFANPQVGTYTFDLLCDYPNNTITESNENNNNALYQLVVSECLPNLNFAACEGFTVSSDDNNYTPGSSITINTSLKNTGNLAYSGVVPIRYTLSGGTVYNDNVMLTLAPNATTVINKTIIAPTASTQTITVTADPLNIILEQNETDNSVSNNLCWEYEVTPKCLNNFWDNNYTQYQSVFLSVGIKSPTLYNADTLKVKFQVSGPGISGTITLGNALIYNIAQNCFCPHIAYLQNPFVFPGIGTYTFTMTVDPDNQYAECNETNNVLVRTVNVTNLPDMRILPQYIAPSMLNPQPGQPITINVTYDNIGQQNVNDQMKMKVYVDNNLISTVSSLPGLLTGVNNTVTVPTTYMTNVIGTHYIRAVIDADNEITEVNETNNKDSIAIVVGESANLYFKSFRTLNLYPSLNSLTSIRAKIGNAGDLACTASVQFFYVNNNLDTIYIGIKHISVNAHDSVNVIQPWLVADDKTTIIAKIINSNILEYNYTDNISSFKIGEMSVIISSTPACGTGATGTITANVNGGDAPYAYFWNTGNANQTLTATQGVYSVTVTDATGSTFMAHGIIIACPPAILNTKLFLQGYYISNGLMATALFNQGEPAINTYTDSVTIALYAPVNGYPLVESSKGILLNDGSLVTYFSPTVAGNSYYLVVKHRNTIETWSANPVLLSAVSNYDFSSSASQAYGNNLIEIEPGIFAIYSGDLNQDMNTDLPDLAILETAVNTFQFGYQATDINGDGNVDLLDNLTVESNINNFIFSVRP